MAEQDFEVAPVVIRGVGELNNHTDFAVSEVSAVYVNVPIVVTALGGVIFTELNGLAHADQGKVPEGFISFPHHFPESRIEPSCAVIEMKPRYATGPKVWINRAARCAEFAYGLLAKTGSGFRFQPPKVLSETDRNCRGLRVHGTEQNPSKYSPS